MTVDRHRAAGATTQDALDTILTNWGAELIRLEDLPRDIQPSA